MTESTESILSKLCDRQTKEIQRLKAELANWKHSCETAMEAGRMLGAALAALRGELEKAKQNYRHIDDDGGCECYDCTVKLLNRSEAALENALSTSVLIWRDRAEKAESALAVFMNLDNWGYDAGDGSFVWEGPVEALPARAQAWPGELGPRTRALPSAEPAPKPEGKPCGEGESK